MYNAHSEIHKTPTYLKLKMSIERIKFCDIYGHHGVALQKLGFYDTALSRLVCGFRLFEGTTFI